MTDPTSLPSFPQNHGPGFIQEHPLRSRVLDVLLNDGHEPTIDSDGDIVVRTQDQTVFVRCLETEPPMMRVFGQWLLDQSLRGNELVRLRAANAVTGALNLVKVTLHEDRLSVAVDLVVADGLDLGPLLASTIDAVLGSVRTWHLTVTEMLG
jgi:hypothetical protein